jgi:hypothetical protein
VTDHLPPPFEAAVPVGDYLDRIAAALIPLEVSRSRVFAAVSVCRDELTQGFLAEVGARWGRPFALGGLGGLPSLGRTGWQACLSHVPDIGGRGHLLVVGMPHIGLDPDLRPGRTLRPNQAEATPTCGALTALFASLSAPTPLADPLPDGLDDHEAQRLLRLVDGVGGEPPGDLVAFTLRAAAALEAEMWSELQALEAWKDMDVVVCCGVQVHVQGGVDHVIPTGSSVQRADGVRRDLTL